MGIAKTAAQALKESRQKASEEIDARIRGALRTITEDPTIKPTQANLAELAGCHVTTLNDREWSIIQLKELKAKVAAKNKIDLLATKQKAKNKRNQLIELNEKLTDEILYWFDNAMALKVQCEALENERDRFRKSSNLNADKATEYSNKIKKAAHYMSDIHGIDLELVITDNNDV